MIRKDLAFGFGELSLQVENICRIIGYGGKEEHEFLISIVEKLLEEAGKISTVRAHFSLFENISLNSEQNAIAIGETSFSIGRTIYRQLKKAKSAAIFVCTAGREIEIRSRKAMTEKDLLTGYALDVIGSEIAEAAADLLQAELENTVSGSGMKISNRYSPGYCGWDVREQHKLFRLIRGNSCGVTINDSALMNPIKSVSGITGIGEEIKKLPYTCNMCNMVDCTFRKRVG